MENQINNTIGFALTGIKTEQFASLAQFYKESEIVGFNAEVKYGVNVEERILVVICRCSFLQNENPFIIIEVANHFQIQTESFSFLIDETNKTVTIPSNFAAHLVLLSIGTTRGILHNKLESTMFNKFLIPSINLAELVKEPVVIAY